MEVFLLPTAAAATMKKKMMKTHSCVFKERDETTHNNNNNSKYSITNRFPLHLLHYSLLATTLSDQTTTIISIITTKPYLYILEVFLPTVRFFFPIYLYIIIMLQFKF